jgi:hypothetical protein
MQGRGRRIGGGSGRRGLLSGGNQRAQADGQKTMKDRAQRSSRATMHEEYS